MKDYNFFSELNSDRERDRLPYVETLPELLDFAAQNYGESKALIEGNRSFSYDELNRWVRSKANTFHELSIPSECNVGIHCSGNMDARLWFLAVCCSGRIAVMLPPMHDESCISTLVERFDIHALITDDGIECYPGRETQDLSSPHLISKNTPAAIFFTGGSTGQPKGVVLSHGALTRGAHNFTYFRAGHVFDNITISILPLYHVYGAVAGFLSFIYTGATIYNFSDIPTSIAKIPLVKPTALFLVPAMVEMLLNLAKAKGRNFLGDLRSIGCGGAPIPARLIDEMNSYGIRIYQGYGQTENASICSLNMNSVEFPHSVGLLCPDMEMKIMDRELWLKGDNVMLGYYNNPEETAEVMEDGWLKTGDLVDVDENGYITVLGRIDNMIVLSNGENVYPEEIEARFAESIYVKSCIVRQINEYNRQILAVEIYPDFEAFNTGITDDASGAAIETCLLKIMSEINEELPEHTNVTKLIIRDKDFPKTKSMKINRKAIV